MTADKVTLIIGTLNNLRAFFRLLAYNDWWQGKHCDAKDANPFIN